MMDHQHTNHSHSSNGSSGHAHHERKVSEEHDDKQITRIWVCSWNIAAKDPFKFKTDPHDGSKIPDEEQIQKFEQLVPTNYDLYVFGIQEGISDSFFEYIGLYLNQYKMQRIPLSNSSNLNSSYEPKKAKSKKSGTAKGCFGVHGRGDGSFLSKKFTGMALYYRSSLKNHITLKAQHAISVGLMEGSKGAACILLKVHSTTIAFLSALMSSNSTDAKLEHFKILVNKCGEALGCSGFDLLQQFHHIVWFGDLNYRITSLSAHTVLLKMASGKLQELWESDSLKQELKTRRECAFKRFKEPVPRLDFYPTYKKNPHRQLDFDQNPWLLSSMSP